MSTEMAILSVNYKNLGNISEKLVKINEVLRIYPVIKKHLIIILLKTKTRIELLTLLNQRILKIDGIMKIMV
ncbi:MAG: hypothetical protein ABIA63_11030 [bacterium]